MESEQDQVIEDPDTLVKEPTTEASGPEGGGTTSAGDAGGNKRDPMSSGPSIGHTIAGRDVDTASQTSDTNANTRGMQDE